MEIQYLPEQIETNSDSELHLHEYLISQSINKNKVQLSKNVFSFLLNGTKELITQNHTTRIENDKFVIIKSGNCLMSESISLSQNYRSMLLFFSDKAVDGFLKKYSYKYNPQQNNDPFIIAEYDRVIQNIVKSLVHLQTQPIDFINKMLPLKFEEILLYLVQIKGVDFLLNFVHHQNPSAKSFVDTMHKNALKNLSIQELSFLCNMSVSTFKRYFDKEFQTSPIRWFQEKRLEHAAYLLQTKKMRASDVYEQIGFENLSSFVQAYKNKFGTTPKQSQINI